MELYEAAKRLLCSGQLHESCELFTRFIDSHSDSTEHRSAVTDAYNGRGQAKYLCVDFPGAIADYSQALERDPLFTIAWYNRGQVQYRLGETFVAATLKKSTLDIFILKKSTLDIFILKKSTLDMNTLCTNCAGRYKVAEQDLKRALELQPDFTDAELNLAQVKRDLETGHSFDIMQQ